MRDKDLNAYKLFVNHFPSCEVDEVIEQFEKVVKSSAEHHKLYGTWWPSNKNEKGTGFCVKILRGARLYRDWLSLNKSDQITIVMMGLPTPSLASTTT